MHAHGLVCSWRVIDTNDNQYCWIILIGLGFLLVETGVVIWLRNGHEFKVVAFCLIFYLSCTTPSLWIIHFDTANRKLYRLAEDKLNARATGPSVHMRRQQYISTNSSSAQTLSTSTSLIQSIGQLECHDKAWYYMDEQRWLDAIQETMLIVLAICRLLLSREHMTVEKSGIILLITLVNGADLLAMSHSLQYHDVIVERLWMYIGLVLLTIGLFQMAFIDTDGLTPSSTLNSKGKLKKRIHFLQDQNLCPLFRTLFIHDGLLLLYRTLLAARVRCSKPTIIFYMAKNFLMIALHCYRAYHTSKEKDRKKALAAFEHFINPSSLSRKHRRPLYGLERTRLGNHQQQQQQQRLLHRTLRQPSSIAHRRKTKTPRVIHTFSNNSISYPFARRRNDGGRARTAFALYGLPFRTEQAPRAATISSAGSLVAKALVH
ncbi:unnamed protein product [Adineta ricciae]|uniref:Uncharacterized protein n=1 Tax=Adineta ricciae TaxID=249248 RepID=A0A813T355_ADIRI|nr:unnamed protein product [Adineta ricciae]CAF0821348.1 unnamed protein product [Adineta ricciae]